MEALLARSRATPPPGNLAPEVWRRIALAESHEAENGALQRLNHWFTRWPSAALFLATCALAGLLLAEVRASQLERDRNTQLARSYLVLIDPLLHEMSTAPRP
ncbi:MAG: hypothetical protein K9N01_11955 [Cephaloticoccus sp.]|nr:hypothetical protein [Cephaloticoccus sp.]